MSRIVTSDLFDLIASLTKAEKRHFKLYAARHAIGGKNKYVMLFDAVERLEQYDERALVESNAFLQSVDLRSMKSYLYDLILRSLRDLSKERSPDAKVQYQIDKAEILVAKRLYTQAARLFGRTKETAHEQSHLLKELDILFQECSLKIRMEETNNLARHEELFAQQMETLAKLRQNVEYYDLFMRMYYLQLETAAPRNAEERRRLDDILASPLLAPDAVPLTRFATTKYLDIHARACQLRGDREGEMRYAQRRLAFYEADPAFRDANAYEYIYTSGAVLSYCSYFRLYDEFDAQMERLKALREQPINCAIDLELVIRYSELTVRLKRCDFAAARADVPAIAAFLAKHDARIEASSIFDFRIGLLLLAIKGGQLDDALQWLSALLNDPRVYHYPRFVELAKMLGIIVHFEREDERALESAIRSYYRLLRAKERQSTFDALLILFLRKLPGITDRGTLRRALEELRAALLELERTVDGSIRLTQFEFITWLDSKLQGRPFADLLREKEERGQYREADESLAAA